MSNEASTSVESSFKRVSFKKAGRLGRHTNARGRQKIECGSDKNSSPSSEDETKVILRNERRRKNPLIQATTGAKRLKKLQDDTSSSSGGEDNERAKLVSGAYQAKKEINPEGPRDMGATAINEIETELEKDAQTQFEKTQKAIEETKGKADDKVYRGMAAYDRYKEVKDSAAGNAASGFVRRGPIRAPNFLRMSVRWDYAPDLCKDYKETGFCTFGDSCKFLHDRTDYKHGWELERDWEQGKKEEDASKYVISEDEDELPFKCFLCRESFTNPVITKCQHYFCEQCALDNYQKSQKCYVCDKNTGGVFNPAKEIIARMKGELDGKKGKRVGRHGSKSESSESELDEDEKQAETVETEMEYMKEEGEGESDEEKAA